MFKKQILTANNGFLRQTYREQGVRGCCKKISSVLKMMLPLWTLGRRTNQSVAAYFDLITDDARMFYGDNFHFGYFYDGTNTLEDALNAHTDLVATMARIEASKDVLDIGCGICTPAIRITKQYNCHITGVNLSAEQVRQGRDQVVAQNLSNRILVVEENALQLPFAAGSYDSVLCLEVAGDICVKKSQKKMFVQQIHRMLKPGGYAGFSDLVFTGFPDEAEEKTMEAILYHKGRELVTDWPKIFRENGFQIEEQKNIINETMPTWQYSIAVYEKKHAEVVQRYGKKIAETTLGHLRKMTEILEKYGSFPVLSLRKI